MSVTYPPHQQSTTPRIEGVNGQVRFDGQFVIISRDGWRARSTIGKGEKRIPVASLASVQWKPAGGLVNGFIQFETAGQGGTRSRAGNQTVEAAKDENSVLFTKKQMPAFEQLRAAVDQAIAAQYNPQPQMAAPASLADELAKLVQLRDQGILSPAEFEAAKARLLGG
jgi:hypothetical protein